MDTASIKQLKDTLSTLGREELIGLLLRMVKFKKENKELLTFLLFEVDDLDTYVYEITLEIKEEFENYRLKTAYYKRKGCRRILRVLKKYIKYAADKEVEVRLLLAYVSIAADFETYINDRVIQKIAFRQLLLAEKSILKLHEDLQYEYKLELEELMQRIPQSL
ncbi:MAG: hypothetical protein CMC18_01145 [Flavobacteriaceae bacterium]|nr:hypothetical protein [Flavobacteriaceae bacterium]|tara:strand:+ start:7977 stop:8468 length:492 start_codon:yes stop_codon:yes gene_type:complete